MRPDRSFAPRARRMRRRARHRRYRGIAGPGAVRAAKEKAMIRSLTRLEALRRPRMLLVLPAAAAAAAVLAACSSSGTPSGLLRRQQPRGGGRGRPEDRQDRRRDGADQRQGLHPLLVRPRHVHQVELQRNVRAELAAGEGAATRPGSRARSPRSSDPTARPRPPSTGIRCTPSSATPLPGRPRATASTCSAACGTKSPRPAAHRPAARHRAQRRRRLLTRTAPRRRGGLTDDTSGKA